MTKSVKKEKVWNRREATFESKILLSLLEFRDFS